MASAAQILMKLPGIFNASAALLSGDIKKEQLNQVMWRWKTAGLVKPIGDRADVWLNLVVDKELSRERWERAVKLALPSVIVAGHGVLMRSGVTTQLANGDYLINPARKPSSKIDDAVVHQRSPLWMKKLLRTEGAVDTSGILQQLDPGAALADLLLFDPDSIDVDDIEWDEVSPQSREIFEQLYPEHESLGEAARDARPRDRS